MKSTKILLIFLFSLASCITSEAPFRELEVEQVGHIESGIIFPEHLGDFQRGELHKYDSDGLDVSIGYTRYHLVDQLNSTVYVYPAPPWRALGSPSEVVREARKMSMENHFETVKANILKKDSTVEMVMEDDSVVILCGKECDLKTANFLYKEKAGFSNMTIFTTASLIAVDQWFVLFRMTAPANSAGRSRKEMTGFSMEFMKANGGTLLVGGKVEE